MGRVGSERDDGARIELDSAVRPSCAEYAGLDGWRRQFGNRVGRPRTDPRPIHRPAGRQAHSVATEALDDALLIEPVAAG